MAIWGLLSPLMQVYCREIFRRAAPQKIRKHRRHDVYFDGGQTVRSTVEMVFRCLRMRQNEGVIVAIEDVSEE